MGPSVISMIKHMFDKLEEIARINGTLQVLLPEKDKPETLCDLRPISLCNVIYKILQR